MTVTELDIPGLRLFEPRVFEDERGAFLEVYHRDRYREHGLDVAFVQDNLSRSRRAVVRGLHFQRRHPQGKLISVVRGAIYDVAVDLRPGSETFGAHVGVELSDANGRQLWVPPGFAHGFAALSDRADVLYKCTDVYHPDDEGGLLWNDPALGIAWPVAEPILSERDRQHPPLDALSPETLPAAESVAL
jgi:dTDP-4-dehydrorhamnose 3,5-epimerase